MNGLRSDELSTKTFKRFLFTSVRGVFRERAKRNVRCFFPRKGRAIHTYKAIHAKSREAIGIVFQWIEAQETDVTHSLPIENSMSTAAKNNTLAPLATVSFFNLCAHKQQMTHFQY